MCIEEKDPILLHGIGPGDRKLTVNSPKAFSRSMYGLQTMDNLFMVLFFCCWCVCDVSQTSKSHSNTFKDSFINSYLDVFIFLFMRGVLNKIG